MARSTLSGFLVGSLVVVTGAGVVSVLGTPPPPPETAEVDLPAGSGFDGAREDRATRLPAVEPVDPTPDALRADAPARDDTDGIAAAQTASAAAPEAEVSLPTAPSADPGGQPAPSPSEDSALRANATDAPVPVTAPSLPQPEASDGPVKTLPERVAAPDTGRAPELAALAPPRDSRPALPQQDPTPDATPAPDVPGAGASRDAAPMADRTPAEPPQEQAEVPAADPQAETEAPERVPAAIVALPRDSTPARPTTLQRGNSPTIGTPVVPLTERDQPQATPEPKVARAEVPQGPPLKAHAQPFDNPEGKPLMAIVLIDRGDSPLALEALDSFPYPLTFAVDATSPEAKARMQRYRAAGFEVMALTDMPQGATAGDTETLLRATLRELPEVVAVMEGDETGLQASRAVSDQVAEVLGETGHGLVLFPKGLNTAQKLASKTGVPATTLFRDFDDKGQSAKVIRRFLDQAAFKARQQENGVVMLGRLRPETISALLLWGLQDRASRVALAPISALLDRPES